MNLLKETVDFLADSNKGPDDVKYVMLSERGYGSKRSAISFSWAEFAALADFNYDNGYGGNEIEGSLRIVGADWWIERGEYDGSEWWEFKTMPEQPQSGIPCRADLEQS